MKFTANADDLYDALRTAGRARPTSSTMPILEKVLLSRDGDTLRARCTNLEQHVEATLDASLDDGPGDGPDEAALPYDRLTDTLKALPDIEVQVAVGSDYSARITTAQGTYEMQAIGGQDFPDFPEIEADTEISLRRAGLKDAVDTVSFATANDHLRPAMLGALLEPVGSGSRVVATDGHRLAVQEIGLDVAGPDLILPTEALNILSKLDPNRLALADGHVAIRAEEGILATRTLDERYPDYESVIPDNGDAMEVERDALLGAVRRAGIYTSSMTSQIRLRINHDQVTVEGEDVERSSEARETVPCTYDGGTLEIGFNADYLEEVLTATSAEQVRFELDGPNDAAVVRPLGSDEGLTLLLMPVMLNEYA
jgi:DNA polymerase-3 subunit beta